MILRIISGTLRGRPFSSPKGNATHPMGEKIRGAMFNVLGDIEGLTLLDAFAGSGAVSFEAISRGARSALLLELDKTAARTIKENIALLGIADKTTVIQANTKGWSNNNTDKQFDIVVCDPPYDTVLESVIQKLSRHVSAGGSLVVSWPTSEPVPKIEGLEMLRQKSYGNANLIFYKRTL